MDTRTPRPAAGRNEGTRVGNLSPEESIPGTESGIEWPSYMAGGPVRQPHAYLVPSPHSWTKVTDTVEELLIGAMDGWRAATIPIGPGRFTGSCRTHESELRR